MGEGITSEPAEVVIDLKAESRASRAKNRLTVKTGILGAVSVVLVSCGITMGVYQVYQWLDQPGKQSSQVARSMDLQVPKISRPQEKRLYYVMIDSPGKGKFLIRGATLSLTLDQALQPLPVDTCVPRGASLPGWQFATHAVNKPSPTLKPISPVEAEEFTKDPNSPTDEPPKIIVVPVGDVNLHGYPIQSCRLAQSPSSYPAR